MPVVSKEGVKLSKVVQSSKYAQALLAAGHINNSNVDSAVASKTHKTLQHALHLEGRQGKDVMLVPAPSSNRNKHGDTGGKPKGKSKGIGKGKERERATNHLSFAVWPKGSAYECIRASPLGPVLP